MGKTGDFEDPPPENRPLARLARLRDSLPRGPEASPGDTPGDTQGDARAGPAAAREEASRRAPAGGPKLVVQRERKGRGGKTVTRVSGLQRTDEERAELGRRLARALGCGVAREGGDLLAQGDQVRRAAAWLREHVGGQVVEGN